MDWKRELTIATIVKDAVKAADKTKLWPYYSPRTGATPKEILAAEAALGFSVDPYYKDFLWFANGWESMFQAIDIFGTDDLRSKEKRAFIADFLSVIDDSVFLDVGVSRADLYAIAYSKLDNDIFVTCRKPEGMKGRVLWIAGTIIEQYPNFNEFFLTLVDLNRHVLTRLKERTFPPKANE